MDDSHAWINSIFVTITSTQRIMYPDYAIDAASFSNIMKFGKIKFQVRELKKIPKQERVFFVFCLIFLTDSNVKKKVIKDSLASSNGSKDEMNVSFQIILNNLFGLAGKIFDCWKMIDDRKIDEDTKKVVGKFSDTWFFNNFNENFSPLEKVSLDRLIKYFNSPNKIKKIRNKFDSHYDYKVLEKCINNPKIPDFDFYFSKSDEADEAYFSNASMLFFTHLIFDKKRMKLMEKSDSKEIILNEILHEFYDEINGVLEDMNNVIHGSLKKIIARRFSEKGMESIDLPNFSY